MKIFYVFGFNSSCPFTYLQVTRAMSTYICFSSGYEYLFDKDEDDQIDIVEELDAHLDGSGLEIDLRNATGGYRDFPPIVFIHGKEYGDESRQFTYKRGLPYESYEDYEQLVSELKKMSDSNLENAICFQFDNSGNAVWAITCYFNYIREQPTSIYAYGDIEMSSLNGKKVMYLDLI